MTNYNPGGMRRFRIDVAEVPGGWITQIVTHHIDGEQVQKEERAYFGICIAQGCIFSEGYTVVRTLGGDARTETYDTYEEMLAKYPEEDGSHRIRWEDMCCFFCGSTIDANFGPGFCSACGVSWDSPVDWPEPSKGVWKHVMTLESGVDNQSD